MSADEMENGAFEQRFRYTTESELFFTKVKRETGAEPPATMVNSEPSRHRN